MLQSLYWDILEYSANLVEASMMIVLLQQFLEARHKRMWPSMLSILCVFAMISILNRLGVSMLIGGLFYAGAGILLAFLLYYGTYANRVLVPVLMVVLVAASEVLTVGILMLAFGSKIGFTYETPYRLLGIIVSKVVLIALVRLSGRFSKKENYRIPLAYYLCMMTISVVTITSMVTILQYSMQGVNGILNPVWFAFSAVGLMGINLLVVYLFEAFMRYNRNQSRYELMLQQAEMLSNHLRETNTLQEETNRIWHDMKNHFTVIQWMVKSQNFDKLEQYMQTLNDTVESSAMKIQTGNHILDALLNTKYVEARKYGIEMNVDAYIPAKLSIDDIDLNILFSNALDNATEACRKLAQGQERFISISIRIKNDHLVIKIENPFNGEIKKSGSELMTTKQEAGQHGIGMRNMKMVVEKYDGHIMTNIEENIFILSAMLYCGAVAENAV